MAQVVWAQSAVDELDRIADYIALDKPAAARSLVRRVIERVERLREFPESGSRLREFPRLPHRQVIEPPCRVIYRIEGAEVLIVHVMRSEQRLRRAVLTRRR